MSKSAEKDLYKTIPAGHSSTAMLKLSKSNKRELLKRLSRARRLKESGLDVGEALRRLADEAPIIEACAERAEREGGFRLPGKGRMTRLQRQLEALIAPGSNALTEQNLLNALRGRGYTQRELWAVPEALRIAIVRGYVQTARSVLRAAEECTAAEFWMNRPKPLHRATPAFIEHVLRLCGDAVLPRPRALLERYLQSKGLTAERVIRQAHDACAHDCLRLQHLSDARRLLDAMDWHRCFETLSEVDAALRRDPAGVYPQMDDASRQAVRHEVERLSHYCKTSELAVARHAVAAAREAKAIQSNVCWWLYTDDGRRDLCRRMGVNPKRLPRLIPDPSGRWTVAAITLLTTTLTAGLWFWLGVPGLLPVCIPLGWMAADALAGRAFPCFVPPAMLLKLDITRLPDEWRALIVTPVLIPNERYAEAMCDNLEALGVLEDDPNLSFLLLGDFADAPKPDMPEDDAIVERIRARIAAMNDRAGREKYFFLHRHRTLLKADHRFMGRDRKRGAIEDLNRLLTGRRSAFIGDGASLSGRFAFVVTLDADTRMLPGTAHRLVGALAHPLNERYAVLQPRMETAPSACVNRFAQLFSGAGGLDTYPTSVSSLWMDMTGTGVFGGKGVYHVGRFQRALDGALPEGRILSHDQIEGALSGAGFLGDIALYDGCPATFDGWLKRLHRWTRGDWQLLPLLFALRKLSMADRFRMLDNLIRSLLAPAQFTLLLWAVWTGDANAMLAALISIGLDALLHPLDRTMWARAQATLIALPRTALCSLDAAVRALWRAFISGKHLLDWLPSADAERSGAESSPLRYAGVLPVLPGLVIPGGAGLALALCALFWVGPDWFGDMEKTPVVDMEPLTDAQRDALLKIARDTWRLFAKMDADLPPDNIQIDPPAAPVRRTSPTNIGLYLLSCAAAQTLHIIGRDECHDRIRRALDALDESPRWRGHIYNWIDIDTRQPLSPRSVSSVDSGNLAACAICCAHLLDESALSARLLKLAQGMDFKALYDARLNLFHISMDMENDVLSPAHYDLLASESRILSYTAMMLGQIPLKHWRALGRPCTAVGRTPVLLSWSGTMFEYLMPELLMKAPALSLLGQSVRGTVAAQMAGGKPWGVSESGYHGVDQQMYYQYRAFGLKALALSGSVTSGVVSPYAAALALSVAPSAAADNLKQMEKLGWRGNLGFYEAADMLHPRRDGSPAVVMSHMAHHQGMMLCAICNALADDRLVGAFMSDPRARALSLLLEERCACTAVTRRAKKPTMVSKYRPAMLSREARNLSDVHLLTGRRARAFITPDGAIHYSMNGIDATRFGDDLYYRPDSAKVWARINGNAIPLDWQAVYDAGFARFTANTDRILISMTISLSPEDDTLYRAFEMTNTGDQTVWAEVLDSVPVALARPDDIRAHAAFQRLFVQVSRLGDDGLLFTRRPRNPGEKWPALIHRAKGFDELRFETDFDRLMNRGERPTFDFNGKTGAALDSVSALCAMVEIRPGETRRLCTALKLVESGEPTKVAFRPERAAQLSRARLGAMLDFLGISPAEYQRLDRLSALLMDPHLAGRVKGWNGEPGDGVSREALWSMGLSGDHPIISLVFVDAEHTADVRAVLRAHAFYAAMGLTVDLALVDACPGGYRKPGRDALSALIDASTLRGRANMPGGVWLLSDLTDAQSEALRRASSIALRSGEDFGLRIGALLSAINDVPEEIALDPGMSWLKPEARDMDNSFGGFAEDDSYHIDIIPGKPTPAPWCNILSNNDFGLLLTERGGGFLWHENSRSGRLTEYRGDASWLDLRICRIQTGETLSLLPADRSIKYRMCYSPDEAIFILDTEVLSCKTTLHLAENMVLIEIQLDNRRLSGTGWTVCAKVRWLMGTDARDAVWVREWHAEGACFASGAMPGVGFLTCDRVDSMAGDGLCVPLAIGENRLCFAVGWAENAEIAMNRTRSVQEGEQPPVYREESQFLRFQTPDAALNRMLNTWLPHQVRASRVYGRTGFYQPGGAYGFRDQLQDMLALLPTEPARVRAHILMCAGRQFAAGDVLHWWHMPHWGVRTRITDDRLFLPYVVAAYVRRTGDYGLLSEAVPYLEDVPIPEDKEDVYCEMRPGAVTGTLHEHCMRAFQSVKTGDHGLALMGAGDWNDGMNRVGHRGKGESVWLSEFIAACADDYAEICPDLEDAEALRKLARRHRGAVELYGWDGRWYKRAFNDNGEPLGSAKNGECRIDLIAQVWAVLGHLSRDRCRIAMDAAWDMLVDEESDLIRLLDPPFSGKEFDPGYIAGYPGGVRENGAQYTHAACWLLLALVHMGDTRRAHEALRMLLPPYHADTEEKARRYRVEPYVTAGDIYTLPGCEGRGGWTWYTGSAAWLYVAALELLGFERKGDRVRFNALLGEWPEVSALLRFGKSIYRLVCRADVTMVTLDGLPTHEAFIPLTDDGLEHVALFPARKGAGAE